jgi:polar amino acid transport system substrate-binding protein
MKKNKFVQLLVSVIVLLGCFPVSAQTKQETVLERIARTGALRVGVREDSAPLGYRDINNHLAGVCLDYINYLRERVQAELNLDVLTIVIVRSTLFNRFYLVEDKVVDVECGPNSIQHDHERDITFSTPFFITQAYFFIRAEDRERINLDSKLENVKLGVLRYSSTQTYVENKFSQAIIQEFQGYRGRRRGVQAVQTGQIDAFASDGILLLGEALLENLPLGSQYILISEPGAACEFYGMILPKNDPQWEQFVNSLVSNAQTGEILKNWFGLAIPYLRETIKSCLPNSPR